MSITKTEAIERITVVLKTPADTSDVIVQSRVTWDDPDDDQLPIMRENVHTVQKYETSYDENQQAVTTENDITGEDQMVQDICALIWGD